MYNMRNKHCCVLYTKVVKRANPKSPHHKEKFFFFLFYILYLYETTDVHQTYCDHHFMSYVSQIIMLYTFNLNNAVC